MGRGQVGSKSQPRASLRPATLHPTWDGRFARPENDERLIGVDTLDAVHQEAVKYYRAKGVLGEDHASKPQKAKRKQKVSDVQAEQTGDTVKATAIGAEVIPDSEEDELPKAQDTLTAAPSRQSRKEPTAVKRSRKQIGGADTPPVMVRRLDQSALFAAGVVLEEYIRSMTRSAYQDLTR